MGGFQPKTKKWPRVCRGRSPRRLVAVARLLLLGGRWGLGVGCEALRLSHRGPGQHKHGGGLGEWSPSKTMGKVPATLRILFTILLFPVPATLSSILTSCNWFHRGKPYCVLSLTLCLTAKPTDMLTYFNLCICPSRQALSFPS